MGMENLLAILKRMRRYASFFEWPDKQRKELGILEELVKSMHASGDYSYRSPARGPGPNVAPDCTVQNAADALVAVEVRELVSQRAIELNQEGKQVYCDWSEKDVVKEIGRILAEKDAKTYSGGPYAKIMVVIHTDEPAISYSTYSSILEAITYPKYTKITEAYLVFSYDPGYGGYPYKKLKVHV